VTVDVAAAVTVAAALVFGWTNGLHDAANAVATSISTRALTPRRALWLAAGLNVIGALLGVGVARTIGSQLVSPTDGVPGIGVVLTGVLVAIAWNLLTWWRGIPSSSWHALFGGLAGASLVASVPLDGHVLLYRVLLPMLLVPVLGFLLAAGGVRVLERLLADTGYAIASRRLRVAQVVSACTVALGHGLQDGQKTMGVILLALFASGHGVSGDVPWWVRISAALAIGLGTWSGGWPLMRTLGRRVVHVDPVRGFAAETSTAALLYSMAYLFAAPASSTQAATAGLAGAGASSGGWRAPRWPVLRRILLVWLATVPACGLVAAAGYLLVQAVS
jgi:PiT family inorganic phosphate transporter